MPTKMEITAAYKLPKAICLCGHNGNGPKSYHKDGIQHGHGACTVPGCACPRFTWKSWTRAFSVALHAGADRHSP